MTRKVRRSLRLHVSALVVVAVLFPLAGWTAAQEQAGIIGQVTDESREGSSPASPARRISTVFDSRLLDEAGHVRVGARDYAANVLVTAVPPEPGVSAALLLRPGWRELVGEPTRYGSSTVDGLFIIATADSSDSHSPT